MPQKTTFVVVRHGESDANQRGIISDKLVDHPLTEHGLRQAQNTAETLRDSQIDLIISSTRQRAKHTGEAINAFHNVNMVFTDDLIERDYGIFSGISKSEAKTIMVADGFGWLEIPESETAEQLDTRVKRVVSEAIQKHAGKQILISTHEDVIRSFFRVLAGKTESESASLTIENSKSNTFEITV